MPNPYIENQERWLRLSEVDYLGFFANAWLAFNAWYRNAYNDKRDRVIIDAFKDDGNIVRSKMLPLLGSQTEEAVQLKSSIGQLHQRLENYHLISGKDAPERVTLTNVYLRMNQVAAVSELYSGVTYSVDPKASGNKLLSTVTNRAGAEILKLQQDRHDPSGLEADPQFAQLSRTQAARLLSTYRTVNPRNVADLTDMGHAALQCGAYQFASSPNDLFAGLVEVLYLMRCTLFHGELVPCKDGSACYEPAYNLVRTFLSATT